MTKQVQRRIAPQDRTAGLVSLVLVMLLLAAVGATYFVDPGLASSLFAFILFDLLFGREAAMMLGATLDLPAWLMFAVNVVQSLALGFLAAVAILYFVDRRRHGWIARWAKDTRSFADRRRNTIDRWGPLGIFLFMLVPFLAKPVFGALAGRLAGLEMRQIVVPVTAASILTAAAWAYFSVTVVGLLFEVWEGSGFLLTLVFVLLGVGLMLLYRNRQRHKDDHRAPTAGHEA